MLKRQRGESEYAGIIYTSDKGDKRAEIDIYIKERYRGQGIGQQLCEAFFQRSLASGYIPSWDCYSNNEESIRLAKKVGFKEAFYYNFYNIEMV